MLVPRICLLSLLLGVSLGGNCVTSRAEEHAPLALHPENPHYFLFRKQPTILITSGEHYGAVLNRDFDYVKYLDELAAHGLNNTRTFTGAYVEPQGAFNIAKNTLAPAEGKFISPWARSSEPGYALGGNKFDLTKWDDAYFARLKDFVAQASKRGVIVEMSLFCPFYEEMQWKLSPFNAINNVNGLGKIARTDVYTLDKHAGLLVIHEALTRKIVEELNAFDNLYYEICNEPYFGGVTIAWQHHVADVIVESEKKLPKRHLIAQNIANGSAKIDKPHPSVSIFNFHYANPPQAVAENYALNKPIGDNETGFKGTGDEYYRKEAWQFILAGGALFNHLDYSFTVGHEDGSFAYPATQPGGGNRKFRQQMKTLQDFMCGFDFVRMQPIKLAAKLPEKGTLHALAQANEEYALYLHGAGQATIEIPLTPGTYEWFSLDPQSGKAEGITRVQHKSGNLTLTLNQQHTDLAISLRRLKVQ